MRYVIAGGSIAAYYAYNQIKQLDRDCDITVISKENSKPYSKMLLAYLLSSKDTINKMFFDIDNIVLNSEVVSIDINRRVVKTLDKREYSYDKLLIATGADSVMPAYNGDYERDAVVGVRYLKDIERIEKRVESCGNKHIILAGAGLVTLEIGWALVQRGFSLTYIVRSKRILSQILDDRASELVENHITSNFPVRFIKEDDVSAIEDSSGFVEVRLQSNQVLKGCMVIVGKGVKPNIEFLNGSSIDIDSGISVDRHLRTNIDDIFAAGDAAAFDDIVENKRIVHPIWPAAIEQAKAAAKNMAGLDIEHPIEFARNILPVFNLNIFTGGASNKDNFEAFTIDKGGEYRKVVLHNGRLIGFSFIADIKNYGAYTYLARNCVDVSNIIDKLMYGVVDINRL